MSYLSIHELRELRLTFNILIICHIRKRGRINQNFLFGPFTLFFFFTFFLPPSEPQSTAPSGTAYNLHWITHTDAGIDLKRREKKYRRTETLAMEISEAAPIIVVFLLAAHVIALVNPPSSIHDFALKFCLLHLWLHCRLCCYFGLLFDGF